MALNSTPGDPNATSLVSETEAETYMAMILPAYSTAWTSATQAVKDAALQQATLLMFPLPWIGRRASQNQPLCWPRVPAISFNPSYAFGYGLTGGLLDKDLYPIDQTTVPQIVKNACIEFAFRLLSEDRSADAGGLVSDNLKLSSMQFTNIQRRPIPASVLDMLSGYLLNDPRAGGMLVRG